MDRKKIDDTRNKILDEFEPIIAQLKRHNYLQVRSDENLYAELDLLRKIRNRIHIQNRKQQLDKDELVVWSDNNVELAGNSLERICKILYCSYPRPGKKILAFLDFPRPWH